MNRRTEQPACFILTACVLEQKGFCAIESNTVIVGMARTQATAIAAVVVLHYLQCNHESVQASARTHMLAQQVDSVALCASGAVRAST